MRIDAENSVALQGHICMLTTVVNHLKYSNERKLRYYLYTGGTIGMSKDFETGALKAFNFNKLLQRIPELKQLDCEIETLSFEDPY
jgi:L-asparaginase/Glu-tRNA(Gln) amidotransferase subunit D